MEAIAADAGRFLWEEVLRSWPWALILLLSFLSYALAIFRNARYLRAKLGCLELEIDNHSGGTGGRRPPPEDRPSASDAGAEVAERAEVRRSDGRSRDERGPGEVDDGERPSEGRKTREPRPSSTARRDLRMGLEAAGRGGAPAPGAERAAGGPRDDRRRPRGRRRG